MDNNNCPFCHAPAESPCMTAAGNYARQPHAARVKKSHEIATRRFANNEYVTDVRERDSYIDVRLACNPAGYDPCPFLVITTPDESWEVLAPNDAMYAVSADFRVVTDLDTQEICSKYPERYLAIRAAKAGAKAIEEYFSIDTALSFLRENEWEEEIVVSHLAEELGTDYGGALIALAGYNPPTKDPF